MTYSYKTRTCRRSVRRTRQRCRAQASEFRFKFPVQAINVSSRSDVFQIGGEQLATGRAAALKWFRPLRKDVLPCFCRRIVENDLSIGSAVIGLDQEFTVYIIDNAVTVVPNFSNDRRESFLTFRKVAEKKRVAL